VIKSVTETEQQKMIRNGKIKLDKL